MKPTLTTSRIRLEPLTTDHVDDLVELDSDAEVMRFISGRAMERDEVIDRFMGRRLDPEQIAQGLGWWAGYARDDGRFYGWWSLDGATDPTPGRAEIGWRLRRDAWRQGLATEGARALLAHGFDTLELDVIWAETMAVNVASRGVMHKLDMRHVRTEVREWEDPLPGADEGEVFYEITREEWPNSLPKLRDFGEHE